MNTLLLLYKIGRQHNLNVFGNK